MDVRAKIIDRVLESLPDIDKEIKDKIEHVMLIQLQDYEVQERCTDIIIHDETNLGLVRKFIATKKLEGKSIRTLKRYQPELEKLVAFLNKRMPEVSPYDLRLYLPLYKDNHKISNRTLENMRKTISSYFTWLQDEGVIAQNPARAVKQIKYDKIVRKPFTAVEREKLKNACENLRDLALSEFLYASGLRVSEVISLDRSSIDFTTREATVIGKGGKERRFYLSEVSTEYLRQYLNNRDDNNCALFVSNKAPHRRLTKEGIEFIVKRLGKRANVNNVHPHRFRRTLATDLVRKGVPIQDVAQILGHSDLRTTQVYVALDQATVKYRYNQAVA
ncbi:MAG TPA: tyrosine-type recombinase/integrase [Candidatus Mediterraneibacter norfolkensis]|nr:tyrosine-type recombinase/integrase [Candidatus Mediterraneibacter norfolkensis]